MNKARAIEIEDELNIWICDLMIIVSWARKLRAFLELFQKMIIKTS